MNWFSRDNATYARDPRLAEPPVPRPMSPPGTVSRLLGGSPLGVALRLVVASIVVGALMVWLDIHPEDILVNVRRIADQAWAGSFDAVRQAGRYLLIGAVIVVPVFLIARLLSYRRTR